MRNRLSGKINSKILNAKVFIHRNLNSFAYIKNVDSIKLSISKFLFRYNLISEKTFDTLLFRIRLKYKINWKNPKTFNEKINYLKLYKRNPIYTQIVDKVAFKPYIADKLGLDYVIPTLGVWDNINDIDFKSLPSKYVIKCNHGSGKKFTFIVDKHTDVEKIKKIMRRSMRTNIYKNTGEWPYNDIKRKIIAEEYIEDINPEHTLSDYKFFCFDGKPKFLQITTHLDNRKRFNFFNLSMEPLDYYALDFPPVNQKDLKKPTMLKEMISIAEKLSEGFPFIRVDLYNVENRIYVGELTFYPLSGYLRWKEKKTDLELGEFLNLGN